MRGFIPQSQDYDFILSFQNSRLLRYSRYNLKHLLFSSYNIYISFLTAGPLTAHVNADVSVVPSGWHDAVIDAGDGDGDGNSDGNSNGGSNGVVTESPKSDQFHLPTPDLTTKLLRTYNYLRKVHHGTSHVKT